MDNQNQPINETDSLETVDVATPTETETSLAQPSQDSGVVSPNDPAKPTKPSEKNIVKKIFSKLNIYVGLLIFVLLAFAIATFLIITENRKSSQSTILTTQKLSQDALDKLSSSDVSVGDAKQTLNVESNAVFSGSLLIRGNADIAGTIKIGGSLTLPALTVGGTANVDLLAAKSLTVAGDTAIQGKVSIQNGLNVTGSGNFSGALAAAQITTDKLQISGDLLLNRHINPNGATPGHSSGTALGGGGTASNNGTDTAGTITINTGNAAPAGCFITITFAQSYANIPHVIISPSSSSAAGMSYYTTRNASNFTVCTASVPPSNTSNIIFDYVVFD